ncbi:endonuclease [Psychroserpens sp. NJDZ02]|uniref:endonuclease n=1 Tax=Psychroserpens sp. NJDZ02 TaxID=2570561 RepID=UPI0010A820EC|nr:endonuclease [Psychroserpens sp. NJDZ02]QCE42192.1 T9SS type A sorting domain-containing protein [Psychroserpens sp. NJDZ02]
MKHFYLLFSLLISALSYAQLTPPTELQAYYSDVDFTKTQLDLFEDLAVTTAVKHTNSLSYTPGIWEASKVTDEDIDNPNNVILFYGYSDTDGNGVTDRSRNKNLNGGGTGDWNREHVFPQSLANPDLDSSGTSGPPYADGHNLRPSDVQMNSNRGNKKFAAGSGNAGNTSTSSSLWYAGDEFKGDAARIIMYMYTRYGTQCLPYFAVSGTTNSIDPNMIDLLLEWNAEDPVSLIEDNRNTFHGDLSNTYAQGNRNPFIDNPYLATVIWGGTPAENRWGEQPEADTVAPTVPTGLVASNPTEDTVDLTWTASTDDTAVVTYIIYVDGVLYTSTSGTATTFTVTGLDPETTYVFTVLAKDAANNSSAQSTSDTATTLAGTPAGTSCINPVEQDFELMPANSSSYSSRAWTDSYGEWNALKARTDQNINGSRAIVIDTRTNTEGRLTSPLIGGGIADLTLTMQQVYSGSGGTLNIYVNGVLKGDVTYDATVQTATVSGINTEGNITVVIQDDSDSSGARVAIDNLFWTCYETLSTSEFDLKQVKVYPNPLNGTLLNIEVKEATAYKIFDLLGKKILTGNVTPTNKEANVSRLSKGVYIMKLESDNGTITKKIIKN